MDTRDQEKLLKIRQSAGIVFQNPDNQIVGSVVEEDVAFGPENIGVPTKDIWSRVAGALEGVGMTAYRSASPNHLSGGQKQRIAIAGIMAMEPECIILDEPTAMLDPKGRQDVLSLSRELNKEKEITIILITHDMEEVLLADKVFVMDQGKVVMSGKPKEVFAHVEELKGYGLEVPFAAELAYELKKEYQTFRLGNDKGRTGGRAMSISLEKVSYIYEDNSDIKKPALIDIDLEIGEGEFIGIIGHTGSGKSTLIQHLNGLMEPTKGRVYFEGKNIHDDNYDIKSLRGKVGLCFQYPEHQLFETTILEDVCFGPMNFGASKEEAVKAAKEALKDVGISEELFGKSPFELSGGQKRRVAIAGILAMKPEYFILDEPTAGLDPEGRVQLLELLKRLNQEQGITIILVSHSMEDIASYVDRMIVMNRGRLEFDGDKEEVFSHQEELEQMGLSVPFFRLLANDLKEKGFPVEGEILTLEDARRAILKTLKKEQTYD